MGSVGAWWLPSRCGRGEELVGLFRDCGAKDGAGKSRPRHEGRTRCTTYRARAGAALPRQRTSGPEIRWTADLLFTRARVAVFIDGCFWHGCPAPFTMPATNTAFWAAKIDRNRQWDAHTTATLEDRGWVVLHFWEHEKPLSVASRIAEAVRDGSRPQTAE